MMIFSKELYIKDNETLISLVGVPGWVDKFDGKEVIFTTNTTRHKRGTLTFKEQRLSRRIPLQKKWCLNT